MHDVKIAMTGPGRGELFLDGQPVAGVVGFKLEADVDHVNRLTIRMLVKKVDVDGVADVTTINDDSRKLEAADSLAQSPA